MDAGVVHHVEGSLNGPLRDYCGGKPVPPRRSGQVVAAVKWVDGTVLDSVWKVER